MEHPHIVNDGTRIGEIPIHNDSSRASVAVLAVSMKVCSKCGVEKEISNFRIAIKLTGYRRSECRGCVSKYRKKYNKGNKKKIRAYHIAYRKVHGKEINLKVHKYCVDNKEAIKSRKIKKLLDDPDFQNRYVRERRKVDIQFRLTDNLRSRVYVLLFGKWKSASTMALIGCDVAFLISHLENQFDSKMSWDNYGIYWHIDHRIPCASFDLSKKEEQKKCFHYSNLQPLEKIENIKKGAKILPQYL